MNEEMELNRYLKERQAYSNAYKNAKVYTSSEGTEMMNINKLDPDKVKLIGVRGISQENGLEFDISQFEVELPNGEKTVVTVDIDGNSMSCDFLDENGESQKFLLTPNQQEKIMKQAFSGNIQGNISTELIKDALFPSSQEDMEKEIEKDTLVPKDTEETIKKIKSKDPKADVKAVSEEIQENEQEEKINLPENIRDTVSEIKEKDGASLKHVLVTKNPQSVADQLMETTGIKGNGEPVYCLSFRSADIASQDRIVLVQGNRVIDERKNDEPGTAFMSEYRNSSVVENIEDDETKIFYTDIHGNTHVSEMQASPSDLSFLEKEELEKKLVEIDSKEEGIKSSDMPIDKKIDLLNKINEERLDTFDEYGIDAENIRDEIEADIEIGEDTLEDIEDEMEEEGLEEEEIEDSDIEEEAEIDEDEGYDPRDTRRFRH